MAYAPKIANETRSNLQGRLPVYHWTERRIRAHIILESNFGEGSFILENTFIQGWSKSGEFFELSVEVAGIVKTGSKGHFGKV